MSEAVGTGRYREKKAKAMTLGELQRPWNGNHECKRDSWGKRGGKGLLKGCKY